MGWSDLIFGPNYINDTMDSLTKEKVKTKPKEKDVETVKKHVQETSKPSGGGKKKATKTPPKTKPKFIEDEDPAAQFIEEGSEIPPPGAYTGGRSQAPANPFGTDEIMKKILGGGEEGDDQGMSLDEMSEMLKTLMGNKVQLPDFDLGIKSAIGDVTPEQIRGAPFDVRPVAAMMDDIYGTTMHARTKNLPKEYFDRLTGVRDLREGSRALQQVKGQAALEKYKEDLKQLTGGGPLEMSQALENLAQIRSGKIGGAGGMGQGTLFNLLLRILEDQKKDRYRGEDLDKEERRYREARSFKLQEEMRNSLEKMKYQPIKDSINKSRQALMKNDSGTADYQAIIAFIKQLDADSSVMWGEVQGFTNAVSIADRWKNLPEKALNGTMIPPEQRAAMMEALTHMERFNTQRLKSQVRSFNSLAKQSDLTPADVTHPIVQGVVTPEQILQWDVTRKDGKRVRIEFKATNYFDALKKLTEDQYTDITPAGAR